MAEYWTTYDPWYAGAFLGKITGMHDLPPIDGNAPKLHRAVNEVFAAASLTEEERNVLGHRFGLNASDQLYSITDVAALLEKGTIEIRHIENNALGKLRRDKVKTALEALC